MLKGNDIIIGRTVNGSFQAFAAVRSHTISVQCGTIEKASPNSGTFREFEADRTEWSLAVSYLVSAVANLSDVLTVGQTYTIVERNRSNSTTLTGTAICTKAEQDYSIGSIARGSFQFKGTGPLTAAS